MWSLDQIQIPESVIDNHPQANQGLEMRMDSDSVGPRGLRGGVETKKPGSIGMEKQKVGAKYSVNKAQDGGGGGQGTHSKKALCLGSRGELS